VGRPQLDIAIGAWAPQEGILDALAILEETATRIVVQTSPLRRTSRFVKGRRSSILSGCTPPVSGSFSNSGAHNRIIQFYGKSQGALPARAIFLWCFPFFCAAEKPEK